MKIQVIARPTVISEQKTVEFTKEELNSRLDQSVQSIIDRLLIENICLNREEAIVYLSKFLSSSSNLTTDIKNMVQFNELNGLTEVRVLAET